MKIRMLNLYALIKYHPYHSSTFARYADVTSELLWAAICGEEEMTTTEMLGIAIHFKVPMGVISCPRLIWLDKSSYRHRMMVYRLAEKLDAIRAAAMSGNEDACYFVRQGGLEQGDSLISDFQDKGKVLYCRYLGTLAFADIFGGLGTTHKPRGLKAAEQKGGAV
ncbi:hypothetical protein NSB25_22335 [Acetatifactor muris]|uniref:Uncharacterized protein n=1 Tax=Acetatifactor muris TaxID=879566 RepID=A0A2K4ZMF4_9FIRM|nr:hypothetical protein [Acetatifactor muris]MCR2049992.1 hypothetical protein [Acetatifactor muris]SOY31658.1 hypothetical protein AMURIS_04403 [Acetatifactor muris]